MKKAKQHDKLHDSTSQHTISSGTLLSASEDIRSIVPSSSVATNLTSPSKTQKFKTSIYSINSIPEQPEEVKNKFPRRESVEVTVSPTRAAFAKLSPSKPISVVNALLRPKFTRSRSSIASSTEESKPTTIDDFADTDSSEEGDYNESGEISSIILGYFQAADSARLSTTDFVFRESFDDPDPKTIEEEIFTTPPSQSPLTKAELPKKPVIDVALANSMGKPKETSSDSDIATKRGSASSSASSMKFRLHNDKLEPISRSNSAKRKVLSTSSNIDGNRSSLYDVTTLSDNEFDQKYPDPTVTPLATPLRATGGNSIGNSSGSNSNTNSLSNRDNSKSTTQKDDIIHHSRHPRNISSNTTDSSPNSTGIAGISSLAGIAPSINNRDTFNTIRSSMSSGELLNKLENFYDISENSITSKHNEKSINKHSLPPISSGLKLDSNANLTAGLDSSSELPIMLYKVQDKDYDESNQRWSVYEHRVSGQSYYKQQHEKQEKQATQEIQQQASSDSSSSEGRGPKDPSPKRRQPSSSSNIDDNLSKPPPIASLVSQESSRPESPITRTPSSSLPSRAIPPLPSSNLSTYSVPQPAMLRDSLSRQNSHELMFKHEQDSNPFDFSDIEKQSIDYPGDFKYYSWLHFAIMMLLGLVICPLYFLLAFGMFDYSTNKQFYSGLYYSGAKANNRRFSKLHKLISLVIGIVWFLIVISMIGVGLGLGTR